MRYSIYLYNDSMSVSSTDSSDISNSNIFPYGGCPVENITGVWRFLRPPLYQDATSSIPGHLLHYIISGSYKVSIGKKQYYPKKGDILYYYGSEQVVWIGDNSYVDFYSVGFTGTAVPVLSAEERIVRKLAED